jgi:hypothetical protein
MLFLVRPVAIGLATWRARMTWRERLLVGWIGPRGVVAAAVAGLAGQQLGEAGYPDGRLILPLVFCVIAATVVLHGLTLGPLARRLGLASGAPPGVLIVGASAWTVALAAILRDQGVPTLITDPSWAALRPARARGLPTLKVEILSALGERLVDLRELDYLLAATDDDAYNALVCTRFAPEIGRERVHQPPPAAEREGLRTAREWRGKYSPHPDLSHTRLGELARDGFGFRVRAGGEAPPSGDDEAWPVLALGAGGALSFFSPDQAVSPTPTDKVIWFERLAPAPARRQGRRWRPWRASAGETPATST